MKRPGETSPDLFRFTLCRGAACCAHLFTTQRGSVNGPRSLGAKALLLWLRLRNDRWRHRLFLERVLQDFVQRVHVGDFDVAENLWSEIRRDIWRSEERRVGKEGRVR